MHILSKQADNTEAAAAANAPHAAANAAANAAAAAAANGIMIMMMLQMTSTLQWRAVLETHVRRFERRHFA